MKQFLLPDNFNGEKTLLLGKEDSHYLKNVRRFREGDVFNAADTSGGSWKAVFAGIDGKNVILELEEKQNGDRKSFSGDKVYSESVSSGCVEPESDRSGSEGCLDIERSPYIILCQCLPKGKKMDLIVRQATEAGVSEIQPLESEFSIVKYDRKNWKSKLERFNKIAKEAFQQSGSKRLPVINEPVPLTSVKTAEKGEIGLFFHQKSIENISLHKYLFTVPDKIKLIIGPEGGLSDKEIEYLRANSFRPVYLGENILRTETAALYAAAAVKTILLERNSWKTV